MSASRRGQLRKRKDRRLKEAQRQAERVRLRMFPREPKAITETLESGVYVTRKNGLITGISVTSVGSGYV